MSKSKRISVDHEIPEGAKVEGAGTVDLNSPGSVIRFLLETVGQSEPIYTFFQGAAIALMMCAKDGNLADVQKDMCDGINHFDEAEIAEMRQMMRIHGSDEDDLAQMDGPLH